MEGTHRIQGRRREVSGSAWHLNVCILLSLVRWTAVLVGQKSQYVTLLLRKRDVDGKPVTDVQLNTLTLASACYFMNSNKYVQYTIVVIGVVFVHLLQTSRPSKYR